VDFTQAGPQSVRWNAWISAHQCDFVRGSAQTGALSADKGFHEPNVVPLHTLLGVGE